MVQITLNSANFFGRKKLVWSEFVSSQIIISFSREGVQKSKFLRMEWPQANNQRTTY